MKKYYAKIYTDTGLSVSPYFTFTQFGTYCAAHWFIDRAIPKEKAIRKIELWTWDNKKIGAEKIEFVKLI